ncbi:macrophage mannose receptor 1-like [Nelusetta ayraudi]|uniref:macrophage mannose receptor 1-like n=1 Tax=Nelusetta ayraudi TaxID=303726 RepID=UPI003F6FE44C
MLTWRITLAAFLLWIPMSHGVIDDSPFVLMNKATGFCIVKRSTRCLDVRWTSNNRLFVTSTKKCLGTQGKTVGSEVSTFDCDDKNDLQKWECRNETLLALKGQNLYVEVRADDTMALSRTVGPNNQLTITGTSSGACSRTHRVLYTIEGNAFGKPCMFPFLYKDRWYGDCTAYDSSERRAWCAIGTRYQQEQWGYCPTTSSDHWQRNLATGAYYQINKQSVLTWAQADTSCTQQGSTLLSVTDPHEQAFVSALVETGKHKLWIGLVLDPEHGWQWSDAMPFRYLRWSTGQPLPNPGYNCAYLDFSGEHSWQSSSCTKKLGYICYKAGSPPAPPQIEHGYCSNHWIPYDGHCFHLNRAPQTWFNAQKECRKEEGDLVSIRNVEDQSFVISQLGYASTDELWIGLNDIRTEGLFDWGDHSTVSYTSWTYGKPTVSINTEDCVLITGENGNWQDRTCDERHGFICMKQSTTESTGEEVYVEIGCKFGWKRHGSYCYFVGTATKTFNDAKADCVASDSYLADVSNGVDNAFLVSLVGLRPEKHFWLGLSNQENIDEFVWTKANSVTFTHWNTAMPGSQQGCVAMTTGILAGLWDLLPCSNTEKYICKHLAEGAVLTVPPPTQAPPTCQEGWTRVGTRNYCAKFFTGPRSHEKTWFEARDYCRAIGGDLLSIHSSLELYVGRHGRAWIGLHVPDPSTGYVWSDRSSVNFLHWQEGEPNNFNDDESCAEYRIYSFGQGGSWNDMNCESYNDWLCQIRAGVIPIPPPNNTETTNNLTSDGWIKWRENQYYINENPMYMDDARHYCRQRHGDLVSINSKDENTFIWKQISRNYGTFYIGMSVGLDGSLWWMDGTTLGIQRWDENEPNTNNVGANCVLMTYYMGFWTTCNCGQEHRSICKRPGSTPANSTVAPTVPPKGGCPLSWTKFDTKCYNIITDRVATWEDARRQCISFNGQLVSIPTRRIQAFLTTKLAQLGATDLWIGLRSTNHEGFFWSDGKPRLYINWGKTTNRPHHDSFYQRWNEDDCVVMSTNPLLGIGKWLPKSCNNTYGFICNRDLDPSITAQPDTIPVIYVTLGNDSLKVVTKTLTWEDAKKNCEGEKANLVSIRNQWSLAYVELMAMNLKAPVWIGLNKKMTGGYFRYTDGWKMSVVSWGEEEPSKDKPCVYVDIDGKYKTALCNQTLNSICMQTSEVPPTESTLYPGVCPEDTQGDYRERYSWLPYKGHCYLFVTDLIEWADAVSSCVRHGGTLASIEDPDEQKFIASNLELFKDSHTSFWVGLYKTHRGSWKWLDKTVLDFTNWAEDEPENDFGEVSTADGAWKTGRGWHDRGYICETPKVNPMDPESEAEPHGSNNPQGRARTSLVVVLVFTVISTLMAIGYFLYKRSPIPLIALPTFENPLYFDGEPSQPDVVDTNKMIAKEEENPEQFITL